MASFPTALSSLYLLVHLALDWRGLSGAPTTLGDTLTEEPFPWDQPRLPNTVRPDHYFIYIHPDLTAETFTGQVEILVTAVNDTSFIILNSKGLTITSAFLKESVGQEQTPLPLVNQEQPTLPVVNQEQSTLPEVNQEQPTLSEVNQEQPTLPVVSQEQSTLSEVNQEQTTLPAVNQEQTTLPVVNQEQPTLPAVNQEQTTLPVVNQEQPTLPAVNQEQPTVPAVNQEQLPLHEVYEEQPPLTEVDQEQLLLHVVNEEQLTLHKISHDQIVVNVEDIPPPAGSHKQISLHVVTHKQLSLHMVNEDQPPAVHQVQLPLRTVKKEQIPQPTVNQEQLSPDDINEQELPEPMVNQEQIPLHTVNEEELPQPTVNQEQLSPDDINEQELPEPMVNQEQIPLHTVNEEELPQPTVNQEQIPLHEVNEHELPQTAVNQEQIPLHTVNEEQLPQPTVNQVQIPLHEVNEQELPQTSVNQEQIPLHTVNEEQLPQPTVNQVQIPLHEVNEQELPEPTVNEEQLPLPEVNEQELQPGNCEEQFPLPAPGFDQDHISSPTVNQDQALTPPQSLRVLESPSNEELAFIPQTPLRAGQSYWLSISYNGTISDGFSGLYKASYQTLNGTFRTIVATHFEPSSARKAFPCFDEPSMKALFSLVLVRDSQHISLSNMPKASTKMRTDGLLEDHYLPSVKMSTYLVAFVICDFSSTTAETKRGIMVSVYAPSHQVNQTEHALQTAVKLLDFYEEYFQIPYPLPKMDLVAIPDFEAGAMENWGLVTYREVALLYEDQTGDLHSKLWISLVTAHELAHQWFGNLVTMEWWNDLWLNEGFASYLEYVAVNHLEPSWCVENQLLLMTVYKALAKDAFVTSHPVSLPVSSSAQIRQMFDVISYSKGASILRMLHTYLTDSVFNEGIRLYLRRHQYSSTRQDDLWMALSEVAQGNSGNGDVKALMDSWTTQQGYPVVSVKLEGKRIRLRQSLFTVCPQNETDSLWQVPFTFYTSSSSSVNTHLMKGREETIDLPGDVSWIKANVNSSGFYRVSYDTAILRALTNQLHARSHDFSVADRASLVDDTFHLASQGSEQYSDAFTLSLFLKDEEEFLPISIFLSHMTNMVVKFTFGKQPCITHLLKEHTWCMLRKMIKTQRWEDESSLPNQSRRAKLLSVATEGLYLPAAQEALRLFHFWMAKDGNHPLPRTLRSLIFRVGIRRGGQAEWSFLWQKYQESASSKERVTMLAALCHTISQKKRTWLLRAALQNSVIKTQDLDIIVAQLVHRPWGSELVWTFLRNHWDELVMKFSLGSSYLSGIVTAVTSQFDSQKKYDEVYDFFVTQRSLGHLRFVQLSLEMIRVNVWWLQTHTDPVMTWLQKTYPKTFRKYHHCKREVTYRVRWGTTILIRT